MNLLNSLLALAVGFGMASYPAAQDPETSGTSTDTSQPTDIEPTELVDLTSIDINQNPFQFQTDRHIDVDGDGIDDLALQTKADRGPLSTYYTVTRLVCVNGSRLLKGGLPMKRGEQIVVADLLSSTLEVGLCSVGGSLRFPDRSFEEFSGGNWWGKEKLGLPMVLTNNKGEIRIGYVILSVSKPGKVSFGKARFVELHVDPLSIEDLK